LAGLISTEAENLHDLIRQEQRDGIGCWPPYGTWTRPTPLNESVAGS
jgi:hypothetical protein